MIGDEDLGYITIDEGRCNSCGWVNDDGLTCKAFPQGIPEEILIGQVQHTGPYPGDNGLRFKAWR